MKVEFWVIGKTNTSYLKEGILVYEKRLKHYLSYSSTIIPDIKNPKNYSPTQLKKKEGESVLDKVKKEDYLVLLDENGKHFSSEAFAKFMEQQFNQSKKRLIFLVGGAFGFSDEVYARANQKIALSKMTFSHQMVRLFFVEQLYRAMTILKNEPYHNR